MPKLKSSKSKMKTRPVPFVAGFKPVTKPRQMKAITGDSLAPIPRPLQPGGHFPPLPDPSSDLDWLAQFREDGQTFKQFLRECPWLSSRKVKYMRQNFNPEGATIQEKYPEGTIYIQPLGDFDSDSGVAMEELVEYTRLFFCLPVDVLPPVHLRCENNKMTWIDVPSSEEKALYTSRKSKRVKKHHLNARFDAKSGRRQLAVDTILLTMKQYIPDNALCLIALTMEDLYEAQSDLFVAGMAAGNHRVAIFSFFRYEPGIVFSEENWFEMKQTNSSTPYERKKLLLHRSCKLLVHEISHLLGIDHCIFFACCMNGSGNLAEDFRQPMQLCPVDLHKLQVLCGFDIVKRYEGLQEFFRKHQLCEELNWVKKRLNFLLSTF
ncbi:archaemetzincin-2 [Lingula anatina]|uniref:Archaemetzincin-2 n=1 Tax=Lingula anatina TaxID=7574 RepID=A0A1S3H2W2_LINAN|nr:archaemetzincin-2 [Lingula anatina]|eukprot:XP_013380470.1 archaemetzincin-2 [Lingula anatina]